MNEARDYRKKQNRLVAIVKEIGAYVFYLVIIAILCFESRDMKSYQMVETMNNMFVRKTKTTNAGFSEVILL